MRPAFLLHPATSLQVALLTLLLSTDIQSQTARSLHFDGSADAVVTYEHQPEFDSRAEMTVEAWVYREGGVRIETILSHGRTRSYWFGFRDGVLEFSRSGGALASADPSLGAVPPGQWTHVAVSYDGERARFYVDGEPAGEEPVALDFFEVEHPLTVGGDVTGLNFRGYLDEVRLWAVARSAEDIRGGLYRELRVGEGLAAVLGGGGWRDDASDALGVAGRGTEPSAFGVLPRSLSVPRALVLPTMDGKIETGGEYAGSEQLVIRYRDGREAMDAVAYLVRTDTDLYIGVRYPRSTAGDWPLKKSWLSLLLDPDFTRDPLIGHAHYEVRAYLGSDFTSVRRGNGDGRFVVCRARSAVVPCLPRSEWQVARAACRGFEAPPCVEFRISKDVLGEWSEIDGLAIGHFRVGGPGDDYLGPLEAVASSPETWAEVRYEDAEADPDHGTGESLRIGTYNTQFLSPVLGARIGRLANGCCEDIPGRARRLAQRILESDFDIIVLNEMFMEDVKERLVDILGTRYRHFVQRIGTDRTPRHDWAQQDSGLMLLSRFPFDTLPRDTFRMRGRGDDLIAFNGDRGSWEDVAFVPFSECSGIDCHATKGAAYVRIIGPGGRIYNIVFTHLQAGDHDVRLTQFAEIEELIRGTLFDDQLEREDLFILGDLNTNGDIREMGYPCPDEDSEYGRCRWEKIFDTPGSFFTDVVGDTWEFETQDPVQVPVDRRDPGCTTKSFDPRARIDYILRSHPPSPFLNRPLCVQHMTLARNLRDPDVGDLSDHVGLRADLNIWAPHASSREAREISGEEFDHPIGGGIPYPGSMHWFLLREAGTYSFALSSPGDMADFRVYESTDMTTPIASYRGETTPFADSVGQVQIGRKYHIGRGPFFVRVFGRERDRTGYFELTVHRHRGGTREDALVLHPNWPEEELVPDPDLSFGVDGAVWFQLDTEEPDSERAQTLRFSVDYNGVPEAFSIELLDEDGAVTLAARDGGDATGDSRYGFRAEFVRRTTTDNRARRYLRVWMNVRLNPRAFRVGWTTNLTVFHGKVVGPSRGSGFELDDEGSFEPLRLQCLRQTDQPDIFGVDDDHVRISISLDDALRAGPADLGSFDRRQIFSDVESRTGLVVIRYLPGESVRVELLEADSALRGDDDRLESPAGRLNARDLRSPHDPARRSVRLTESGSCTICGKYRLDYNLSHGLQEFGSP